MLVNVCVVHIMSVCKYMQCVCLWYVVYVSVCMCCVYKHIHVQEFFCIEKQNMVSDS